MPGRRDFLFASLAALLVPGFVCAGNKPVATLSWPDYLQRMKQLALKHAAGSITQAEVAADGIPLLQRLDTASPEFRAAVDASSESGNRYWLWQRLTKESGVNGGILTIEAGQDVPLHDHPGATGMLRVVEGEAEVWQFNRTAGIAGESADAYTLERVSHRILQPGDLAVLSPHSGNIHALRARTRTCRMLDYFIPPYRRSQRTWYEPLDADWHARPRISCRGIPEDSNGLS